MTAPDGNALIVHVTATQREQTIDKLSRAFAEDTITMEDFEHRAEAVYRALTVVDLNKLVADLTPAQHVDITPLTSNGNVSEFPAEDSIRAAFGSAERNGAVHVARRLKLRSMFGNIELDYSRALFAPGITEVDVRCTFGNIEITVPRGVRVELACNSLFASVGSAREGLEVSDGRADSAISPGRGTSQSEPTAALRSNSQPVLRLTGRALFANVEVHIVSAVTLPTITDDVGGHGQGRI